MKKIKRFFDYKFIILIVAVIIFNFIYFNFVYKNLISIVNDSVYNTVSVSADSINSQIEKRINEAKIVGKLARLNDNLLSDEQKLDNLTTIKDEYEKERLFMVSLNGRGLSNYGEEFFFNDYDFFKMAKIGTPVMGTPFFSSLDEKNVVPIAVPVRNTDTDRIECILVSYYSTGILRNMISDINISNGTISMIINDNGEIIASEGGDFFAKYDGKIPEEIESLADSVLKGRDGFKKFRYLNTEYTAQYTSLENGEWIMAVSAPTNALYRRVNLITAMIIILTAMVILLAVFMGIYTNTLSIRLVKKQAKINDIMNKSLVLSITVDKDYKILDFNKVLFRLLGYTAYELKSKKLTDILAPNYEKDFLAYMEKLENGESVIDVDIPLLRKNGKTIYVLWNVEELNGGKTQLVGINITRVKEYEEEVHKSIFLDSSTGLYNSAYMRIYFNSIYSKYEEEKIAFIYIDIDNFKYINDVFGHENGEEFIKEISDKLIEIKNENAKIFRKGGDEFIALYCNASDRKGLDDYIEKLRAVIYDDYYLNGVKTNVTASIGVSTYPDDGIEYSELVKTADIAMNSAKQNGKSRVQFFNERLKSDMLAMLELEKDLKRAVENEEFLLHYQPQYDIETGKLYGFEALIRWANPKRGLVSPGTFIPFAEKSKMIIEIGTWALEESCKFINKIRAMGYDDICISVNVSVIQMNCDDYVEKTLGILKKYNIRPENIKLEITESVLMESIDEMLAKINFMNEQGIKFALDDFGTGYSSLTYLKKIPLQVLKIDKSFVDMISEKKDNKIISAIIDLAHDINLDVVAEGIEENDQLRWLKSKGCNIAQGYYMGRPMPENEAIAELGNNMYIDKKKE